MFNFEYIYVWFPLVPHWDVLSVAWKCSKYRFWVCYNDFILRTSPLWRFWKFFSKWCSKCLSVAIMLYLHLHIQTSNSCHHWFPWFIDVLKRQEEAKKMQRQFNMTGYTNTVLKSHQAGKATSCPWHGGNTESIRKSHQVAEVTSGKKNHHGTACFIYK